MQIFITAIFYVLLLSWKKKKPIPNVIKPMGYQQLNSCFPFFGGFVLPFSQPPLQTQLSPHKDPTPHTFNNYFGVPRLQLSTTTMSSVSSLI